MSFNENPFGDDDDDPSGDPAEAHERHKDFKLMLRELVHMDMTGAAPSERGKAVDMMREACASALYEAQRHQSKVDALENEIKLLLKRNDSLKVTLNHANAKKDAALNHHTVLKDHANWERARFIGLLKRSRLETKRAERQHVFKSQCLLHVAREGDIATNAVYEMAARTCAAMIQSAGYIFALPTILRESGAPEQAIAMQQRLAIRTLCDDAGAFRRSVAMLSTALPPHKVAIVDAISRRSLLSLWQRHGNNGAQEYEPAPDLTSKSEVIAKYPSRAFRVEVAPSAYPTGASFTIGELSYRIVESSIAFRLNKGDQPSVLKGLASAGKVEPATKEYEKRLSRRLSEEEVNPEWRDACGPAGTRPKHIRDLTLPWYNFLSVVVDSEGKLLPKHANPLRNAGQSLSDAAKSRPDVDLLQLPYAPDPEKSGAQSVLDYDDMLNDAADTADSMVESLNEQINKTIHRLCESDPKRDEHRETIRRLSEDVVEDAHREESLYDRLLGTHGSESRFREGLVMELEQLLSTIQSVIYELVDPDGIVLPPMEVFEEPYLEEHRLRIESGVKHEVLLARDAILESNASMKSAPSRDESDVPSVMELKEDGELQSTTFESEKNDTSSPTQGL